MDKKKKFTEKGKAILERTPISNLNDFFEDIEKHENKHIDQIPVEMINPNPNQARKYFDRCSAGRSGAGLSRRTVFYSPFWSGKQ